jgi:hypothetical protein
MKIASRISLKEIAANFKSAECSLVNNAASMKISSDQRTNTLGPFLPTKKFRGFIRDRCEAWSSGMGDKGVPLTGIPKKTC